ncbi:DUF6233 domain-containing protein [Streptomyces sp. NPDC001928]|uniref:DUF6233 domain-containing protein n=1 Tax=Streptomyces sp. NPDC001928 TaxID=3154404 RepID=UPI0033213540
MFDDLPPDLERLHTLRVWYALWVERIDRKIAAVQRRQAEEESGRRNRPERPDWIVELGIGADRTPVQVHAGDCYIAGKRRREVSRDEARRLLAAGLASCTHCEPDTQLHILDLARLRQQRPLPPRAQDRTTVPTGAYSSTAVTHGRRPEQDAHDDYYSPAADHRAGPVRARLLRRPGRPVLCLPSQDPQVRPRRHPAVSVVHGSGEGEVGSERAYGQYQCLTLVPPVVDPVG